MRQTNQTEKNIDPYRYRRQRPLQNKPAKPSRTWAALKDRALVDNLTSLEVSKLSGATLRQLQWWDEQKLVCPIHSGHARLYTPADTRKALAVTRLREHGISLQRCRQLWRLLVGDLDKAEHITAAMALLKRYKIKVR